MHLVDDVKLVEEIHDYAFIYHVFVFGQLHLDYHAAAFFVDCGFIELYFPRYAGHHRMRMLISLKAN